MSDVLDPKVALVAATEKISTETHRIGVVGCGFFGQLLAESVQQVATLRLVAVADVNEESSVGLAQRLGVSADDPNELMGRDDVDAIILAIPNDLHVEAGVAAIAAGKHVFVEKPLALTGADARRIVDAALSSDRVLAVGHILRTVPGVLRVRNLVHTGTLGQIISGNATRSRWIPRDTATTDWWKLDTRRTGGELLHELHELDLLTWMLGEVADVTAEADMPIDNGAAEGGLAHPDRYRATLTFASGARATYELSTATHRPRWDVRIDGLDSSVEIDFRTSTATQYHDGQAIDNFDLFGEPELDASLRAGATTPQRYNRRGGHVASWMRRAVELELIDFAGALTRGESVLTEAPGRAVETADRALRSIAASAPSEVISKEFAS